MKISYQFRNYPPLDTHYDVSKYFSDIDDCDPNPCMNGGVCTDGIDAYTCTCAAGYTGENCEESTLKHLYHNH